MGLSEPVDRPRGERGWPPDPQEGPADRSKRGSTFSLKSKATDHPASVGDALRRNLSTGENVWQGGDGKWYMVTRQPIDDGFQVSIAMYDKKPTSEQGGKPANVWKNAYFVKETKGQYRSSYEVYKGEKRERMVDLDTKGQPVRIPTNFAEFKMLFPVEFKEFYDALIIELLLKTINKMKKEQAKMRAAMRKGLES